MSPSRATTTGPLASRARLRAAIPRRPRVGAITGLLLALAFALLVTPIVLAEAWLVDPQVAPGEPAPVTVRLGPGEAVIVDGARHSGGVIIARGEVATEAQAQAVALTQRDAPRAPQDFAAYGLVLFALAAAFTHHLRRSTHGRLLRVQLVLLGTIAIGALVTKGLLLAYPLSVLAVPVALGAIVPTLVHDRTVGLTTGMLAAVVMALLVRFDVGVLLVLVVQAVSAALVVPERPRARWLLALVAGLVAAAGAALTYLAYAYLTRRALPFDELATPAASSFVAAIVGGLMASVLAVPVIPLYQRACGEITDRALIALSDLSHPLLRQIAEKSPGTWQHSLAMANLAEVAAQAIGASGRLVRVGAYFHDLGKSLQPTYFIENLTPGEPSPHDQLAPEVSCDAIFAHVTEGLLLARRQKLPERVIDFMHMHHGNGVLEYFWGKCQDQGNPRKLTVDDFRYPGVPPQSRETAILAVCDAVEAASRTLKRPDSRSVENLVQRIVYGKLHLGQLDESGLSMSDLRRMSDALREAIRHAHHERIEYPWQKEAAAEAGAATAPTVDGKPEADRARSATHRMMMEPRLDSLDAPRPMQWEDRSRDDGLGAAMTASGDEPAPDERMPRPGADGERMPRPKAASEATALSDTLDLAIVTTAGLGAAPARVTPAAAPAAVASAGPTADALADAVVNAEAPSESHARHPATLPRPLSTRLPAIPSGRIPTAPIVADEAAAAPPVLDEERERRAARPTEPIALPSLEERARRARSVGPLPPVLATGAPLERDDDEPEIEIAAASGEIDSLPDDADAVASADDAVIAEESVELAPPAPVRPAPAPTAPPVTASAAGSEWLGRISARIDALLEAEEDDAAQAGRDLAPSTADDDAFEGDTIRRPPPEPPPGRSRPIPRMTQPVDPDDIEASLELSPTLHPPAAGVFVGPPPATRPTRSGPAIAVPPATDDGDDDRPTVVGSQPSGSMLPPRVRREP